MQPEEFFHEVSEVDSLVRKEVVGQLPSVPLIFGIEDFHRESTLKDFCLADLERLSLVFRFDRDQAGNDESIHTEKKARKDIGQCLNIVASSTKHPAYYLLLILLSRFPKDPLRHDFLGQSLNRS